jgi:hypothetical protein
VIIVLFLFLAFLGIETGWLFPYIFKKDIQSLQSSLENYGFRKFVIRRIRGGLMWGVSFSGTEFLWSGDRKEIRASVPVARTGILWKDVYRARAEKKCYPLSLSFFYPEITFIKTPGGIRESLLRNMFLLFSGKLFQTMNNVPSSLPLEIKALNIHKGRFCFRGEDGTELSLNDCDFFFSRASASQAGMPGQDLWEKTACLRGNILGKDILVTLTGKEGSERVYSLIKNAFFGNRAVIDISKNEGTGESRLALFLENFFLFDGKVGYVQKRSFTVEGKIKPENILWQKVNSNKLVWKVLKNIDPNLFDNYLSINGNNEGIQASLSFYKITGHDSCLLKISSADFRHVEFSIDLFGQLEIIGSYDVKEKKIDAKIVFEQARLEDIMSFLGYEEDLEIEGEVGGSISISGVFSKLSISGELVSGKGRLGTMDFEKSRFRFAGSGRFIYLEDSKFVRQNGDIPVIGYFDLGIKNPFANIKIKPKNSLIWSGIDFIRDVDDNSFSLQKSISDRLKLKLMRKFEDDLGSLTNITEEDLNLKIELELDNLSKFLYKKDEEESFIGIERKIRF